jgi:hypothetical protein
VPEASKIMSYYHDFSSMMYKRQRGDDIIGLVNGDESLKLLFVGNRGRRMTVLCTCIEDSEHIKETS